MLAKSWKKICLIILIIACLWNIISKITYIISFDEVVNTSEKGYEQNKNSNKV